MEKEIRLTLARIEQLHNLMPETEGSKPRVFKDHQELSNKFMHLIDSSDDQENI